MRILSKFKDYYDFLQGKYGIDELKVLDRTISPQPYLGDSFEIVFCNTTYGLTKKYDSFYRRQIENNSKYEILLEEREFIWYKSNQINDYKQPIVKPYESYDTKLKQYTDAPFYNFKLDIIGFNKIMPPEQCYLQIEEFLGKIKEEVSQTIPTDLDRFEAKGFDKKTSFRNIK